jgi:cyclophilin family peptidyl-prolyl cis-trans isomerase
MRRAGIATIAIVLALAGCGASGARRAARAHVAAADPCRTVAMPKARPVPHLSAPTLKLNAARRYLVTVTTTCGAFTIELAVKQAPRTAASFDSLVARGFYNGLAFQRVAAGFVIQGGDPEENDTGGPGYTVVEAPPANTRYVRGIVAMARAQNQPPGASGSQFFIVLAANAGLPPQYALVGHVVSGMNVVQAIGALPTSPAGDGFPKPPVVMTRLSVSSS